LRDGVYPRWVVMRTVELLIDWGDARFRDGSWEAINEATQFYLLAHDILGQRPQLIPARHAQALTYLHLAGEGASSNDGLDPFGNAMLTIEASSPLAILGDEDPGADPSLAILSGGSMLYFGIPANERLLGFWDTIEDRLLKIRSSLDFAGRPRTLLPLGPSLAGGLPAGLQSLTQPGPMQFAAQSAQLPLPAYRFTFMLQKAHEFAGEVRAFGTALLAAAEKRDAEQLARLRTSHEVGMVQAMRRVRELQIAEAEYALAAAEQGREGARIRFGYYSSREFISATETVKEILMGVSLGLNVAAATSDAVAAILNAIPQVKIEGSVGVDTSGKAAVDSGGIQLGGAASATARVFAVLSSLAQAGSSMAGSIAGYQRRQEEWDHQTNLAENDIEQFEQQIAGANSRLEIARRELENQEMQLANANDIAAYMQNKFTNEEIYEWMLGQVAEIHFQSYLLAVDVARRAEECFRYECMLLEVGFVRPEQWDDLNASLLAGERLQHDLRRMEKVYFDQNTREYEITKHISLARMDPAALILLRRNGECFVSLPEHAFDADHPGHYLRRIKSVSLSIPSVVGPYTGVNCKLSLVRSVIRVNADLPDADLPGESYEVQRDSNDNPSFGSDPRFVEVSASDGPDVRFVLSGEVSTMVTSHGQNDAGLFEANLRDERYLPFEGAGAISTWRIELPTRTNRFDPATIADVVLHMRYTARDGGRELRNAAWQATFDEDAPTLTDDTTPNVAVMAAPQNLVRLFSAKSNFADAWHRWLHPAPGQTSLVLDLDLSRRHFPYYPADLQMELKSLRFVLVTAPGASADGLTARLNFMPDGADTGIAANPTAATFTEDGQMASLAVCDYTPTAGSGLGRWQLVITASDNTVTSSDILDVDPIGNATRLVKGNVLDLLVLCSYDLKAVLTG
jgi:hypothetical protein